MGFLREMLALYVRWVRSYVIWFLSSKQLVWMKRRAGRLTKSLQPVEVFLCVSDHHSFLLLEALPFIVRQYSNVSVKLTVVDEPIKRGLIGYSTELEEQQQWRKDDSVRLSELYQDMGFKPLKDEHRLPSQEAIDIGNRIFLSRFDKTTFDSKNVSELESAVDVAYLILCDDVEGLSEANKDSPLKMTEDQVSLVLGENTARLNEGHYLSGTAKYGYEWFWGIDRLHYLEQLFIDEGRDRGTPVFNRTCNIKCIDSPSEVNHLRGVAKKLNLSPVIVFYSFRSPYSQLILDPLYEIANFYGLEIDFRPVLPMVMRGRAVSTKKAIHIVGDAGREARRLGWESYGQMNDPVGDPTRNALAIYVEAAKLKKERAFLLAWANEVYDLGTDAHTDAGLSKICQRAGFEFNKDWLTKNEWQQMAQDNLETMTENGNWGVPTISFHFNKDKKPVWAWGQDRLFAIERELLSIVSSNL